MIIISKLMLKPRSSAQAALMMSAVDDELTLSIFRLVLAANRDARASITPSFTSLKVKCLFDNIGDAFESLQRWIGRSWACERRHADIFSNDAIVEEVGVRKRLSILDTIRDYEEEDLKWYDNGEFITPVWERLWPRAKGKAQWLEEWHSFPLSKNPSDV
jgi:hypothetical protein